jgi:hypothetical protein
MTDKQIKASLREAYNRQAEALFLTLFRRKPEKNHRRLF